MTTDTPKTIAARLRWHYDNISRRDGVSIETTILVEAIETIESLESKLRRADLAMAEMAKTIERLVGIDKGGQPETLVARIRLYVDGKTPESFVDLLQEAARELEGKDTQIAALREANASLATDAGLWAKEPELPSTQAVLDDVEMHMARYKAGIDDPNAHGE